MTWQDDFNNYLNSKTSHVFIFHSNVYDLFPYNIDGSTNYTTLSQYFLNFNPNKNRKPLLEYSRTSGILIRNSQDVTISNLEKMAGVKAPGDTDPVSSFFTFFNALFQQDDPIWLILRYTNLLLSDVHSKERDINDSILVEFLHKWGQDREMRRKGHVVLAQVDNIGYLPDMIISPSSQIKLIRIPLPDDDLRRSRYLYNESLSKIPQSEDELDSNDIVNLTKGLNLTQLDELLALTKAANKVLSKQTILDYKKEVIRLESNGLFEIVEPDFGFESVGGLTNIKQYLRDVLELFGRKTDEEVCRIIPKGLLFTGPPGVGKTHIAKAFAFEAKMSFLIMRDIHSKWVGDSERNLSKVIQLAKSLAPVCIFVDEIDQALGRRSGSSGDSGTSQRMFGRILEEMGNNENRGKILWVCATNRPDFLDPAMLSRFEKTIPFLMPTKDESKEIFNSLCNYMGIEISEKEKDEIDWDLISGLTGREIENIVRSAQERAKLLESVDFKEHLRTTLNLFIRNHSKKEYNYMSLLAIKFTNFRDMLPDDEALEPFQIIDKDTNKIDPEKVEAMLRKYNGE